MERTRSAMENVGLQWNPKKCSVVHLKRGVQVHDVARERPHGSVRIPNLEDGKQYKFLGVLESLQQQERLALSVRLKNRSCLFNNMAISSDKNTSLKFF